MASFKWNGGQFEKHLEREMQKRIDASCIVVESHVKKLLSKDGTGKRKRKAKGRKGLVYNASPSRPGFPPALQTGRLRGGYSHERQGMVGRVGTNVKYARPLEIGAPSRNLAARPHLRRALLERQAKIKLIMSRPIPGI